MNITIQLLESCAGRRTDLAEAAKNKSDAELMNTWSLFRKKMNPIRKWYRDDVEKKKTSSDILAGLHSMTDAIVNGNKVRPNKLVKQTKVPSWCKGMKYQAYKKSIEVWEENNKDISEAARYQDVIESLKLNNDIEGLARYTGEHVVGKLDTMEKQIVKDLLKLLDIKYGRTRLEDLEELMEDWIKFNFNEHESEEEYLFAQEKLIARQDEKQVTLKEWNTIWMMYGAKQRKGIENYQLLELRNIVKTNNEEVQKDFVTKYRELKIESNRGKQAPCADTYLMRKCSLYRQRYHDQRTRRDSQGRDFYQERRSRNDSRGRPFYRRYYRRDNDRQRSFSSDMRSMSRNRSRSPNGRDRSRTERERTNEKRSGSKENNKQYKNCIGCKCEDCEKMRKTAKELNIKWCEEFTMNEEILVNFTEKGKQVMILDLGAPVSLAGNEWMNQFTFS